MERQLELEAMLERARERTLALLAPLSEDALTTPASPAARPLVDDLAEVAYFEDLWILRTAKGDRPIPDVHDDVYRAVEHTGPSKRRPKLKPADVRAYATDVRERVLDFVDHVDLDTPSPLLHDAFVFGLVLQHEVQRQETMTETLQLRTQSEYPLPTPDQPDRAPGGPAEIQVPAGTFVLGAVDEPWAYDNELPAREVELPAYRIDRAPVTNALFAEFVQDRGYRSKRAWTDEGWEWREAAKVSAPLYWERGSDGWERIRLGHREQLPPWEPVQHVSWHEASAFATWAGKRLPTEVEWERAASWHRREGKQRYPWGREWTGFEASLDRRRFSPAPAGSYAGGMSPTGCVQMAGDVWEWTSSAPEAYPEFLAFPYPEFSEVFFGDGYRVLRGGSWATDGLVARTTFRNWRPPEDRHGFSGFRCARDA
jgi:gamma-glutamyl hercynylcysteine S-oxide synthase